MRKNKLLRIGTGEVSIYNPQALRLVPEAELRAEYSRLRAIANKRLAAFARSEFRETQIYQVNAGRFVPLAELPNRTALIYRLSSLGHFVASQYGSVTGQRRIRAATLETLHERGYTFVNRQNYLAFGRFMEWARENKLDEIYDSERIAELFSLAEKKRVGADELRKGFDYYMEHFENLEEVKPRGKQESSEAFRRRLK